MPLKTAVSIVQQGIPVKPSRILHAAQHSAQTGKVTNRDYTMPQDGAQTLCISCASAIGSVHGSEAADDENKLMTDLSVPDLCLRSDSELTTGAPQKVKHPICCFSARLAATT
jgi:hypothetical protein